MANVTSTREQDTADGEAQDASADGPSSAHAPRKLSGRLAGLSLNRQIFILAIWPFFQQLLSWLVSFVDTAVAGHLTKQATSAIAVGGYINWFMGLMVMGIGAGGAALIARAIGGGHKRLASAGVGQSLLLGTIVGIVVGLLVYAMAHPIAVAAGLTGQSLALCRQYLWITAAGVPLAAILFVSAACMTSAGDTRNPFYVMVAMNIVNLILTLALAPKYLTFQFAVLNIDWQIPCLGLGVVGIALGTVIGWLIGALLMVLLLLRPKGAIRLHLHRLRPHWHTIKRIWRVAYPNLLDRGGHWVGNWIIIMLVGEIGRREDARDVVQGAHIIAIRIEAISFLPALAFAAAAGTLTGQYLGANDPDMARKAARRCWFIGAGIMTAVGVLFVAVPELLVRILTDIPVFLDTSPKLVRICGFVQFFFGSALVLQGAMRGAGDTRMPAILSNSLTWGFRLPLAFVLGWVFELGLMGIWYALCAELTIRGCVFIARYLRDGWLKQTV